MVKNESMLKVPILTQKLFKAPTYVTLLLFVAIGVEDLAQSDHFGLHEHMMVLHLPLHHHSICSSSI